MQQRKRIRRRLRPSRCGLAATDLAVCLPVLLLIVVATVESRAMLFLQQSLSIAAYEGAKVSLTPGAQEEDVRDRCELVLQDRDVQESTVEVTPTDFPNADIGSWIKVDANAPFADNSIVGGWLFNGRILSASVEMMKER